MTLPELAGKETGVTTESQGMGLEKGRYPDCAAPLRAPKQSRRFKIISKQAGPEATVSQILLLGADRSCAAAHGPIRQTAATGKIPSHPDEEMPARDGELAGAPLPKALAAT
jgi:hypothetical protein